MAKLAVLILFALLGAAAPAQAGYNGYPSEAPVSMPPAASPEGSPQTYPGVAPVPCPPSSTPASASPPSPAPPSPAPRLRFGFYKKSCPSAEYIVREAVRNATRVNPGIGAGLIRMAFHDCFVQGCDGSVLLDPTAANPRPEKLGPPNFPSLRGFEVIDAAKAALEEACPGKVSCADVIQFAARDASFFLSKGGVNYPLAGGRFDGRVSFENETLAFLPPPFFNLSQLIDSFKVKGLNVDDLVVLSGSHTIGRSHCSSFSDRISTPPSDINPGLATVLKRQCPANPNFTNDPTVVQDIVTPNRLDNRYYKNVLNRNVLFNSDASLLTSRQTARKVVENAFIRGRWERKFAKAMVKMSLIEVKTAADGEIRTKSCRVVN
ncbi:peroxidase 2-like [Phragmites australis]|uniref:peroxidase 2-like n=1 Tax=Phragmites australis TaxID=29695 RepID=UPI002D774AE8|nr:peroxidase 2-like [Phragmites australis]